MLSPLANLTGLLAASLPVGFNDEGFPVGCEWQRGSGMNAQWRAVVHDRRGLGWSRSGERVCWSACDPKLHHVAGLRMTAMQRVRSVAVFL